MQTIVVGIDTETPSGTALDWVIERTGPRPAHVRLVTVLGERPFSARRLDENLQRAATRFRTARPDSTVEACLLEGAGIAEVLDAEGATADLVVVGHHRGRLIRSALSGALPSQVTAHAVCPTVVVPSDWLRRYGKVVVGIQADGAADSALEFAAAEAAATGRSLDIVQIDVADDHPGSSVITGPADDAAARPRGMALAVEVARRGRPDLAVRTFTVAGDPNRILRAHARQAALVVVGSHGHGAIDAVFRDARAYNLGNWSKAPVCVVPAGWRARTLEGTTA